MNYSRSPLTLLILRKLSICRTFILAFACQSYWYTLAKEKKQRLILFWTQMIVCPTSSFDYHWDSSSSTGAWKKHGIILYNLLTSSHSTKLSKTFSREWIYPFQLSSQRYNFRMCDCKQCDVNYTASYNFL